MEVGESSKFKFRYKPFLDVLSEMLPPPDRVFTPPSDDSNAIEQRHILIYGGPGSGKTNAFRYLAACLADIYGGGNLHVAYSDADLKGLLEEVSPDSPVQLLCCEDMTRIRQPEEAIHGYFTIRHLMAKRTGSRHGLIVTAFTTHDLYGVQPKALRTNCDLQLFLETPANPYDERLLLEVLDGETYRSLQEVEKNRQAKPEYKGWVAYATKWSRGLTYIPRSDFSIKNQYKPVGTAAAAPAARGQSLPTIGGEDHGLRPFHDLLLYLVWNGYTSLKDLEEKLYNVHPEEIEKGLEELESLGYLRLQGPRSHILAFIFRQDWLLTSRGVDYAAQKISSGEWAKQGNP